jgi:hypothetical protein
VNAPFDPLKKWEEAAKLGVEFINDEEPTSQPPTVEYPFTDEEKRQMDFSIGLDDILDRMTLGMARIAKLTVLDAPDHVLQLEASLIADRMDDWISMRAESRKAVSPC